MLRVATTTEYYHGPYNYYSDIRGEHVEHTVYTYVLLILSFSPPHTGDENVLDARERVSLVGPQTVSVISRYSTVIVRG